jgi:phasin family protein
MLWVPITHINQEFPMLTVDQIASSQKANFDVLFGLTEKAFQGVEKMVELNLAAALNESAQHAHALLSVKDAQELVALQTAAVQPLAEKAAAYGRHVYDIASATNAEFTKAFEQQASQAQQVVVGYIDTASKSAPAGSEPVMALFKSSLAASNNAMDSVQKVVKQATEAAQANLQAMTSSAVSTAVSAAKTASRKR